MGFSGVSVTSGPELRHLRRRRPRPPATRDDETNHAAQNRPRTGQCQAQRSRMTCGNWARSDLQARCHAPNVGLVNGNLLLRNPRPTDLISSSSRRRAPWTSTPPHLTSRPRSPGRRP